MFHDPLPANQPAYPSSTGPERKGRVGRRRAREGDFGHQVRLVLVIVVLVPLLIFDCVHHRDDCNTAWAINSLDGRVRSISFFGSSFPDTDTRDHSLMSWC